MDARELACDFVSPRWNSNMRGCLASLARSRACQSPRAVWCIESFRESFRVDAMKGINSKVNSKSFRPLELMRWNGLTAMQSIQGQQLTWTNARALACGYRQTWYFLPLGFSRLLAHFLVRSCRPLRTRQAQAYRYAQDEHSLL